jgi:hypothetical protein
MLMKNAAAAEKDTVINVNMTAEQTIVRNDDVVCDLAIVADVCAGHQIVFVADFRHATLRATSVNGAIFADYVLIAHLDPCFPLGREGKVLRRSADYCAMPNEIAGANGNVSFYDDVRLNCHSFANRNTRADDRIWSQLDVGSDLGRWIDNGGRVNFQSTPASLKLK